MIGKVIETDIKKHVCKVRIGSDTVLDQVFAPPMQGSLYPQKNDMVEIENKKQFWEVKRILLKNANISEGSFNLYANELNIYEKGEKAFISTGAGWID